MTSTMPTYPVQQQPLPNLPVPSPSGAVRGVALVAALAVAGGIYCATHRPSETVGGHGHGRATVDTSGWAAPLAAFTPLIGSRPGAPDAWSSATCGAVPSNDSSVVANIACTEPDNSTVNVIVFRSASMVDQVVQSAGEQGDDIHSWSHDGGASLGDVITRSTGRPYVATTFLKHRTVIVEVSGLPDVGALTSDWQNLPLPQ
jgi:hypothetical protein